MTLIYYKLLRVFYRLAIPVGTIRKLHALRRSERKRIPDDLSQYPGRDYTSVKITSYPLRAVPDGTGVASATERLETLRYFKNEGIATSMSLMPVIPGVSDTEEKIDESVRKGVEASVDFVIFGGLTLKDGRQKDYFLEKIKSYRPDYVPKYATLFPGDPWGQAKSGYYQRLDERFMVIARKYRMPVRIPPKLFSDILDENDRVVVILEHLNYLLQMEGAEIILRLCGLLDFPIAGAVVIDAG